MSTTDSEITVVVDPQGNLVDATLRARDTQKGFWAALRERTS